MSRADRVIKLAAEAKKLSREALLALDRREYKEAGRLFRQACDNANLAEAAREKKA